MTTALPNIAVSRPPWTITPAATLRTGLNFGQVAINGRESPRLRDTTQWITRTGEAQSCRSRWSRPLGEGQQEGNGGKQDTIFVL